MQEYIFSRIELLQIINIVVFILSSILYLLFSTLKIGSPEDFIKYEKELNILKYVVIISTILVLLLPNRHELVLIFN